MREGTSKCVWWVGGAGSCERRVAAVVSPGHVIRKLQQWWPGGCLLLTDLADHSHNVQEEEKDGGKSVGEVDLCEVTSLSLQATLSTSNRLAC